MAKIKYKSKTEEIRGLFNKFKRFSNAIYWTGILNLVSFLILIFRENKTYTLGYTTNVILHDLIMKSTLDSFVKFLLSFVLALIPSLIFYYLSKQVKKGKLIPLIVTLSIYAIDSFLLFFFKEDYYISSWNYGIGCIVHVLVLFYLLYLVYIYNRIVYLSNQNKIENNVKSIKNSETNNT